MSEEANPVGRPTIYTESLGMDLCARMVGVDGGGPRSLLSVCNDDDMPGYRTIMAWLDDERYQDFQHNYHRARGHRTEAIFEEIRDVAKNPLVGEITVVKETKDGTFTETKVSDNVQRSDLMVKAAMWQLARMEPKKYGDSTTIKGDKEAPLYTKNSVSDEILKMLTVDQLEQLKNDSVSKNNGG